MIIIIGSFVIISSSSNRKAILVGSLNKGIGIHHRMIEEDIMFYIYRDKLQLMGGKGEAFCMFSEVHLFLGLLSHIVH